MITMRSFREAKRKGRDARIAARIFGVAAPENPYNRGTKLARYFEYGAQQADRLIDDLMRIGG